MKNSLEEARLNGNITLEMSIIFPVVFVVIIFILFIGFYMSDIVCIRAVMQRELIIMSKNEISEEEIIEDIKSSTIISNIDNVRINKKGNYVYIEGDIYVEFPILSIHKKENIKVGSAIKTNKDYVVSVKVIFDIIDNYGNQGK